MRTTFSSNRKDNMKERITNTLLVFIVVIWIILSLSAVYRDLLNKIWVISEENKSFFEDRIYYQKEIWEMQASLARIEELQQRINDWLNQWIECNIK
jgi:hypothetical protein